MDLAVWNDILAAYRDIEAQIGRAFADKERSPDLGALHDALWRRLEELRKSLAKKRSEELAMEVLEPLIFATDERVLERLGDVSLDRAVAWPMLQRGICPEENGGEVFFLRADDVLAEKEPPELLTEVLLFCLHAGFVGRYEGDAAKLADYKQKLASRVASPAVPAAPPPAAEPPAVPSGRRQTLLLVAALVVVNVIFFAAAALLW
jgi:type VI secretion system protein ImpK